MTGRADFREKLVFTIDSPPSMDLDDALSIDLVAGNYNFEVHIVDVSLYVRNETTYNEEAH